MARPTKRRPCRSHVFSYARRVAEVLLYTLSFALGIVVPASIVSWDVAHLRGAQLERAWPDAGLWSAVVVTVAPVEAWGRIFRVGE